MSVNISNKIAEIQSSIKELESLINAKFDGKFTGGYPRFVKAAIATAEDANDKLESTKVICEELSNILITQIVNNTLFDGDTSVIPMTIHSNASYELIDKMAKELTTSKTKTKYDICI